MVSFASRILANSNREIPKSLMGVTIDPRIREFREEVIDDPEKRLALKEELKAKEIEAQKELGQFAPEDLKDVDIATVEGISARDKNIKAVKLENFDISMEDADTLTLKPKGLFGGKNIDIRLAGIDAPEVAQHENDPLEDIRINADQPYGKEAAAAFRALLDNQDNKELLVDMGRQSYGRYLGAIIGDEGRNLNIEAVRQGIATALPFGPVEEDLISRAQASTAQRQAILEKKGLWQYARYQAIATSWEAIGRPVTHNTLTRIDKAAENLNLGAYISYLGDIGSEKRDLTSQEYQTAARLGYALRKTHGPQKQGFNKFDGMQEGGLAAQLRHQNTDFGSGFQGNKKSDQITLYRGSASALSSHEGTGFKHRQQWEQDLERRYELIRAKFYPDRPSREKSSFWAGSIKTARMYSESAAEKALQNTGGEFIPDQYLNVARLNKKQVFIGNDDYFVSARRIIDERGWRGLRTSDSLAIDKLIHAYWQGLDLETNKPYTFLDWKQNPSLEALISGKFVDFRAYRLDEEKNKYSFSHTGTVPLVSSEVQRKRIAAHLEKIRYKNQGKLRKAFLSFKAEQKNIFRKERLTTSSFINFEKSLNKWSLLAIPTIGLGYLAFSGKDDAYNTIEGLKHEGLAEQKRKEMTDFGSGYQGIISLPKILGKFFGSARGFSQSASVFKQFTEQKIADQLASRSGFISKTWGKFVARRQQSALSNVLHQAESIGTKEIGFINPSAIKRLSKQTGTSYSQLEKATAFHESFHELMSESGLRGNLVTEVPLTWKQKFIGNWQKTHTQSPSTSIINEEYLAYAHEEFYRKPSNALAKSTIKHFWDSHPNLPRISGFDDAYNTISGLNENGIAARIRKFFGFGSGRIRKLLSFIFKKPSLETRLMSREFSIGTKELISLSSQQVKQIVKSHAGYLDEAKKRIVKSSIKGEFSISAEELPYLSSTGIKDRLNLSQSPLKPSPVSDTPLLSEMPTRNIRGKLQAGASSANGQIKTNFRAMPGRNHSK